MDGLRGGFDLNFLIPDLLKVNLEINADGFSEYFAKYHLKEHVAAAEWVIMKQFLIIISFIFNDFYFNN